MDSLQHDDGFVQPHAGALFQKPKISPKDVVIRDGQGRTLYCGIGLHGTIANPKYEGPVYMFATCQQAALIQFHERFRYIQRWGEVIVGPAIGFFVHDNHGDVLSTGGRRPGVNVADRGTEFEEG